jgi:hypothetical protein
VAEADRKWGRSTYRQRIAAGLEHFERLGAETPGGAGFGSAARVAGDAHRVLRKRWPEADGVLPLYRAFAS